MLPVGSMTTPNGLLIGMGCATATYPSAMAPSSARVRLSSDGTCVVYCGAHDLGTGAYTVLGQVAADVLGVPNELVRVHLGDSTLPSGPVAGGSITTGSSGAAVHMAALAVRDASACALLARATPRGLAPGQAARLIGSGRAGPAGDRGARRR